MSGLKQLWRRLWALFAKRALDAELEAELESHLQLAIAEYIERGISAAEARRLALVSFGGVQQAQERQREARGLPQVDILAQDLKCAVRKLRRDPGFTVVALLILMLGIGANTTIFSLVDAALLKPLPYPYPERIVSVWERPPGGATNLISTMNFLDWGRQNRCFQSLSAVARDTVTLTGSDSPEEINVQRVSASYFSVIGVGAALGRTFIPGEDTVGEDQEVVLSNRIWHSRFGGDPKVLGRKITLDAKDYTIIGVLPANTEFDRTWAAIWLPLTFTPANMTRNYHWLTAIARLAPGATLKQARDQMDTIGARIAAQYPDSNKGWGVTVDPYVDGVVQPELRRSFWVLLAAVGAVLLIGCANLANLTLARSKHREHEVAIRSALGARRLRLVRQLLTENILLAILGCAAGLALGDASMHGIKLWLPPDMLPPQANVHMDYDVLLFTLVIGILAVTLFGLAPALSGTRPDLAGVLKEGGRATSGLPRSRMRTALVIAEVALSFVLLAGAGLLIQSFNRLLSIGTGVDTTGVLAMDLPIPTTEFANSTTLTNYLSELTGGVRRVPGVRDVAITDRPPMEGFVNGAPFLIEGKGYEPSSRPVSGFKVVGPSYFHTVGMAMLKGRGLQEGDVAGAPPVTVINETMAKLYFKGEDPIGKRILIRQLTFGRLSRGPDIPWQVVGVVKDEKVGGVVFSLSEDIPVVYVTYYQSPGTRNSLVVHAAMNPLTLSRSIKDAIWKVNSGQAVTNIETLEDIESQSVAPARLRTVLLAVFAGVAVLLAALGIYGVVSCSVAQRVHEMAIRMALGASPNGLLRLVIGRVMVTVLAGLALGAAAALALARALGSLLYNTSPTDPVAWIATGVSLAAVALLASYIAARRAATVDPIAALRRE